MWLLLVFLILCKLETHIYGWHLMCFLDTLGSRNWTLLHSVFILSWTLNPDMKIPKLPFVSLHLVLTQILTVVALFIQSVRCLLMLDVAAFRHHFLLQKSNVLFFIRCDVELLPSHHKPIKNFHFNVQKKLLACWEKGILYLLNVTIKYFEGQILLSMLFQLVRKFIFFSKFIALHARFYYRLWKVLDFVFLDRIINSFRILVFNNSEERLLTFSKFTFRNEFYFSFAVVLLDNYSQSKQTQIIMMDLCYFKHNDQFCIQRWTWELGGISNYCLIFHDHHKQNFNYSYLNICRNLKIRFSISG